ncbi:MAG TPA: hypothetical protein VFP56_09800 [Candidatus Limnocylindrales bacterium]|nr:hypothetical protein [Candidatus Limnocylindrales bacterium]
MLTFHRRLAALLTVVSLALGACGGSAATSPPGAGNPTAGPGATPGDAAGTPAGVATQASGAPGGPDAATDPCSLLTAEEIKTATGFSPISATPGPTMGVFDVGCEWELDNEGSGVPWSIVIGLRADGGREYYDDYFAPPVGEGEVLQGVGDAAIQTDIGDVNAVRNDVMFSVSYIEFPSRNDVPVALAKLIASKL